MEPGKIPVLFLGRPLFAEYFACRIQFKSLLQFFRTNQLYASFLLIFYAFLLRLPAWWYPMSELTVVDSGAGLWGRWLNELIVDHRWATIVVPVLILFVTAIMANRLAFNERLSRQVTQFPGLFIIVVSSLCPIMLGFNSLFVANLILFLSVMSAFGLYRAANTILPAFNAGLWLGIATLFNAYYVFFFLLLIIIGISLNALSIKMMLWFLAGYVVVHWLMGVLYYLQGSLPEYLEVQWSYSLWPNFSPDTIWNLGGVVLLSGILGFVLFKQGRNVKLLNIKGQKKVNLLYWWLFISLGALLLFPEAGIYAIHLATIPLGILLSFSFTRGGRSAGEAGHLLLILLITALNVYPFLLGVSGGG